MTEGRQVPEPSPTRQDISPEPLNSPELVRAVTDLSTLAHLLRGLRRRHAHDGGRPELTYREMASLTGLSRASIGSYFSGTALPPTDRFDILTRLLGATALEQGAFATARDRVAEGRRRPYRSAGPGRSDPVGQTPAPHQLPADVPAFTGRELELDRLDRVLLGGSFPRHGAPGRNEREPGGICVLSGTAGVGKTALAVHWARRARGTFPDGQFHVDLRGYDPRHPMSAATALDGFLRALGVPPARRPSDEDDLAATWRTLLDGRRMLVILDNASSVEQVRPLLPGNGGCAVLVTSRDSLAGLVARHGAGRVEVDPLPLVDAVALLRHLIGERVDEEPTATTDLAEQGARLPLALRVAAELAVSRPNSSLEQLVTEFEDQQTRLDLLDAGGDPRTAVQVVLSWSYRNLPPPAARLFRLLGLVQGRDLDERAVHALAGGPPEHVDSALDGLVRAHLVQRLGSDRCTQHDLLRAYAARIAAEGSEAENRRALTRLFEHYLGTASRAVALLHPDQREGLPPGGDARRSIPLTDPAAARAWLDAERTALVAAVCQASTQGWEEYATRLAAVLRRYLNSGHFTEGLAIHDHALRAARTTGNRAEQAHALVGLATAQWRQDRISPAVEHLREALLLFRQTDDRVGQARALGNLGLIHQRQGQLGTALDELESSLALSRQLGEPSGQAYALLNIGLLLTLQGHRERAGTTLREALTLFETAEDPSGQAHALHGLCSLSLSAGRPQAAVEPAERAVRIFETLGDDSGRARCLVGLGLARLGPARPGAAGSGRADLAQAADAATTALLEALLLFRESRDRSGVAESLNGLGLVCLAAGRLADARARFLQALDVAVEVRNDYEAGRAHDGLAHVHREAGEPAGAEERWQEALTLMLPLAVVQVRSIRAHLENRGGSGGRGRTGPGDTTPGCDICRILDGGGPSTSAAG
ncbi:MAG: hypothetical protein QG608_2753 [Actinomycetota bacterium]|nr:hypothetical protein [Actinomycetota bacterium]